MSMKRPTARLVIGSAALVRAGVVVAGTALSMADNAPTVGQEIKRVETEIDQTFAYTLKQAAGTPNDPAHCLDQIQTLGKLMLYDKQLSRNRNKGTWRCSCT